MITKEQHESKKKILETLTNAAENVTNRIEKNYNLKVIDLQERNKQINNYFAETNNLSFDVWEYEFYQAKRAYKKSLKKFIKFCKKDKEDFKILVVNETNPSKDYGWKEIEILETVLIKSCEQDYKELVQAAKEIPLIKFSKLNFPVKPIDLEPIVEE